MADQLPSFFNFAALDTSTLTLHAALAYIFLLWVALVVWVARDVVGRTKNLVLQVLAIALTIGLNVFGLIIYLILRPQKTLTEKYYAELEEKAFLEEEELCPGCERPILLEFRYCPTCGTEARQPCGKCKRLVGKSWQACAYCGQKKAERAEKKN